jgi:hypothetical protein
MGTMVDWRIQVRFESPLSVLEGVYSGKRRQEERECPLIEET